MPQSEPPLNRSIYFTKPSVVKEWAAKYHHTFNKAVNLMCYGFLNQMDTLDSQADMIEKLEVEIVNLKLAISQLEEHVKQREIDQSQNAPGGI